MIENELEVLDPNRWIVLIIFSFYSFSNAIQWVTFAPIASNVTAYFHLNTYELNMLSMIYMIIFVLGVFLTCTTFESWGVRKGVLIGSFLNALGAVLKFAPALYFPSYTSIIIPQTLNSAAQLFVLSTPPLLAAQYFPPHRRTFATAVASTANLLGNAVALLVPPLIVNQPDRHQFEILFGIQMTLCVAIFFSVIFFLSPPQYASPTAAMLLRGKQWENEARSLTRGKNRTGSTDADEEEEEEEKGSEGEQGSLRKVKGEEEDGSVGDLLEREDAYCLSNHRRANGSPPFGPDVIEPFDEGLHTGLKRTQTKKGKKTATDSRLEIGLPPSSSSGTAADVVPSCAGPALGSDDGYLRVKATTITTLTVDTTCESEEGDGHRRDREENEEDRNNERNSGLRRRVNGRRSLWYRIRHHRQMVVIEEIYLTVSSLARNRDFVCLWIAFSIGMGSVWAFASVLAQISTPFGLSEVLAGVSGASNVVAGTAMSYLVGVVVDRCHRYRIPLIVCFAGSVVWCIGYILVMVKVPKNTALMNVLSLLIYITAGLFQNTSLPVCFEFAMEISYPHQESVPGALLMAGANLTSLIMVLIASAMLGDGEASPEEARNVVIMITCFCTVGFVFACFPREHLRRREAEYLDRERAQLLEE